MAKRSGKTPEISVITVNYRTSDLVAKLVEKLSKDPRLEVIVVDNDKVNLGFAGANNVGVKKVAADWVMFLNPDTICKPSDLLHLKVIAQKHQAVVSAPKIVGSDRVAQNNVGVFDGYFENFFSALVARPRYLDTSRLTQPTRVEFANGTALLVQKSFFEGLGGWDSKNFFMYFEDIDLGQRLKRSHRPVLFVPDVVITHLEGQSANQDVNQKGLNYQKSLRNYIFKYRGQLGLIINDLFKILV